MAMQRCPNGHMWDDSRYSSCPYDGVPGLDIKTTRPVRDGLGLGASPSVETSDAPSPAGDGPTDGFARGAAEPGVTIAAPRVRLQGIDPVVGWLVCVEGADKGRDYRIRTERNAIGRASDMEICINGDQTIHREDHAYISFNPRNCRFYIQPGEHRGLIYLNGDEVLTPAVLKAYDEIELGATKLRFVPFCGPEFQWEKADPKRVETGGPTVDPGSEVL
jgi:hypothetical protein